MKGWAHHRCSINGCRADDNGDEIANAIKGNVWEARASGRAVLGEGRPTSVSPAEPHRKGSSSQGGPLF